MSAIDVENSSVAISKSDYVERLTRHSFIGVDPSLVADAQEPNLDGVYSGKSSRIRRLIRVAFLRGIRRGVGISWESQQPVAVRDNSLVNDKIEGGVDSSLADVIVNGIGVLEKLIVEKHQARLREMEKASLLSTGSSVEIHPVTKELVTHVTPIVPLEHVVLPIGVCKEISLEETNPQ